MNTLPLRCAPAAVGLRIGTIAIAMHRYLVAMMCMVCALIELTAVPGCRSGVSRFHFPPGAMVLNLATVSDVPTLDPSAGYDVDSWMFEQMLFDTLVRY